MWRPPRIVRGPGVANLASGRDEAAVLMALSSCDTHHGTSPMKDPA